MLQVRIPEGRYHSALTVADDCICLLEGGTEVADVKVMVQQVYASWNKEDTRSLAEDID